MKRLTITLIFLLPLILSPLKAKAQSDSISLPKDNPWVNFTERCKEKNIFSHFDAGISLGSMGVGLEVKTPVTKWVDIRAGVDWLPRFSMPMYFDLDTYAAGMPTGNFNNVASMVYDLTGLKIDKTVNMTGKGSMVNFKFLVDFFPMPSNRHWHITAGFYAGTSKIAEAINTYDEKPTLVALNIYNRAYEYFTDPELSIFEVPLGGGAYLNPETVIKLIDRFERYGRMGIHVGDFSHDVGDIYKENEPYIMEPAPDGTISAKALVNHFKPYVGFGYSTHLDKAHKWNIGVDLGALFWGGVPDVVQHDYSKNIDINFSKDLKNIRGKVGTYMNIVKDFPVYPVFALRISYSIL